MPHTYEELKKKTVAELRDIAKDIQHDAVQGFSQMNKEHLLPAICKALGIEAFEHHAAASAEKGRIKARMRALKAERSKMLRLGRQREDARASARIPRPQSLAPGICEAGVRRALGKSRPARRWRSALAGSNKLAWRDAPAGACRRNWRGAR